MSISEGSILLLQRNRNYLAAARYLKNESSYLLSRRGREILAGGVTTGMMIRPTPKPRQGRQISVSGGFDPG